MGVIKKITDRARHQEAKVNKIEDAQRVTRSTKRCKWCQELEHQCRC